MCFSVFERVNECSTAKPVDDARSRGTATRIAYESLRAGKQQATLCASYRYSAQPGLRDTHHSYLIYIVTQLLAKKIIIIIVFSFSFW